MVHIKKIKTWYGTKYAVVEEHVSEVSDEDGNKSTERNYFAVEYKVGKKVSPAIFPLTDEGLKKAREIQSLFNNSNK